MVDEGTALHRMVVGEGDDAIEVVMGTLRGEVELRQAFLRGGAVLRLPAVLAPHLGQALIHMYSTALEEQFARQPVPRQAS